MQKAIRFVGELIPGFVLALAIATVAYFTAQIQVGENVHGAVTIDSIHRRVGNRTVHRHGDKRDLEAHKDVRQGSEIHVEKGAQVRDNTAGRIDVHARYTQRGRAVAYRNGVYAAYLLGGGYFIGKALGWTGSCLTSYRRARAYAAALQSRPSRP